MHCRKSVCPINGLNELMRKEITNEPEFHFCPSNEKFLPHPDCNEHVECNDPVFRCFDIARAAKKFAKRRPEYEAEYDQVAANSREIAVEILDGCESANDVVTLLGESAGSERQGT